MHSSLFTPAIGLAILSFTSAGVIEKRDTCWEDPAYLGLWGNPPIYDVVNQFCIGLLDLKGDTYCAANMTSVVVSREAITATKTLSTATTVASTITETYTNTGLKINKREALAAVTNADFLNDARSAIKRQAGANVGRGLQSACSCGNVAGSVQLSHTPEICTNTLTKWERGFATATVYTRTVTSGTVTVTETVDKTLVITLSSATATSYALISNDTSNAPSVTYPTSAHGEWDDHWFKLSHSTSQSESEVVTSTTKPTQVESTTTATNTTETYPTTTNTAKTTTTKATGSATTASAQNVWKDWADWRHHTSKTRVMVDGILTNTSTSSVSKPTAVHNTTTPGGWIDFNITATSSSLPVEPTRANSTTESSSVHQSATASGGWADWNITKTTASLPVLPTVSNTTSTSAGYHPNTTIPTDWNDWNITKTSSAVIVHPTLTNDTTTPAANISTSTGYANTTTSSTWFTPNITSTTSSTGCSSQETVYLGNFTTTVTQTVNVTQPASTVTIQPSQRRHKWYGW